MESLTYSDGLKIVSDTADAYEQLQSIHEKKERQKAEIEQKIRNVKESIDKLSSDALSIDDVKRELLDNAKSDYKYECTLAEIQFNAENVGIDSEEHKDKDIRAGIQEEYNNKIISAHAKVDNAAREVSNLSNQIAKTKNKCTELDERIKNSALEENQIKLYASHIASDYENVAKNPEFINEYKSTSHISSQEVQNKFASLSSKKIRKIADKMNIGAYVSAPNEAKGIPVLEILMMAFATLGMVFKGIIHGISLLYRPVKRFRNSTYKIVYAVVVSLVLFSLLSLIPKSFGNGIMAFILFIIIGAVLVFLGMIVINIAKYSNKAFRKEQNLEYYTVGWYFTVDKDAILYKLAVDYYTELKEKSPETLQNILQSTYGNLQGEKENALAELGSYEEKLRLSEQKLADAKVQYNNEKESLEEQCRQQIDIALNQLKNDITRRREKAKADYDQRLLSSQKKREAAEANIEQEAIRTIENKNEEISRKEQEVKSLENNKNAVMSEIQKIMADAADALKRNNEIAVKYKTQEIKIVDKRSVNDKIPDSLVVGVEGYEKRNIRTGIKEKIYKPFKLVHNKKPIIITCDIDDDQSIAVTKTYYSFIDSIIGDLLGKTYIGAFRFVIVDSQGNKTGIVQNMETCRGAFEDLEKFGCVKICTERSDKCFDDVIKEQESLLGGKNIEEVNETNKNLDNMVKYTFLCIRVYSKKTSDFTIGEFRKRIDSSLNNGIIPIIIMKKNYFDEKRSELEGTIKELCDSVYYKLDVNGNECNEIRLEKEKM